MESPRCFIIDILGVKRLLEEERSFTPCVYEAWFSRAYSKAHSVPCVSISLLSDNPVTFKQETVRLVDTAKRCHVDPIIILPSPRELQLLDEGLCFYVKDDLLLIGNSRAIEKCWRSLRS